MKENPKGNDEFEKAALWLGREIFGMLSGVSAHVKNAAQEIRLRAGYPINIVTQNEVWFVGGKGKTQKSVDESLPCLSLEQIQSAFNSICGYSVHSHQQELEKGYLTLFGGHRAGFCGTAVVKDGKVCSLRNVSSINLRIARSIPGAADELFDKCFTEGFCPTIIAGAPLSGKTTLLRDCVRRLAENHKVAAVDERGEIGGVYRGERYCDLGVMCDLLDGYPKGQGIETALRVLSPDIIVFDEAGSEEECRAVCQGLCSGVKFLTTVHAGSPQELAARGQIRMLLRTGAFKKVALLEGREHPGKIKAVYSPEEILNGQTTWRGNDNSGGNDYGTDAAYKGEKQA